VSRYYVVLEGPGLSNPYVIAEVVREDTDDGRYRETSMAGNVGGFLAVIVTEEELVAMDGGTVALERWRTGNDDTYATETVAHDKGIGDIHGVPGPEEGVDNATSDLKRSVDRLNESIFDTKEFRREVREARKRLQEAVEDAREPQTNTETHEENDAEPEPPHVPKRHLRSVS
jgi:hypothetical protein